MKRVLLLTTMCLSLMAVADGKPLHRPVGNIGLFYSSLSPYGEWMELDFGYAWRPYHVSHGWRPYLDGRWVWTDYGWYWVSGEPFGWATYHYGRWQYDDYYGWIWIPDDVWGPAWVEWRYNDDYIGWSPLPPQAIFSVSFGITFSNRWVAPIYYWNFVPCRYMTASRIVDYVQPVEHARRFFGSTRGIVDIRADGDRVMNHGIDRGFVERRGNIRVNRVEVVQRERGSGERLVRESNRDRVEMYRPRPDTRNRGELAPPAQHRVREQQPSPANVNPDQGNQVRRGDRPYNSRERVATPPPVRDTRPRDANVRERVQNERQRELGRDGQRKEQVREKPQNQGRQLQEERSRGRIERNQQPAQGRPQRDTRSQERRPRP